MPCLVVLTSPPLEHVRSTWAMLFVSERPTQPHCVRGPSHGPGAGLLWLCAVPTHAAEVPVCFIFVIVVVQTQALLITFREPCTHPQLLESPTKVTDLSIDVQCP